MVTFKLKVIILHLLPSLCSTNKAPGAAIKMHIIRRTGGVYRKFEQKQNYAKYSNLRKVLVVGPASSNFNRSKTFFSISRTWQGIPTSFNRKHARISLKIYILCITQYYSAYSPIDKAFLGVSQCNLLDIFSPKKGNGMSSCELYIRHFLVHGKACSSNFSLYQFLYPLQLVTRLLLRRKDKL